MKRRDFITLLGGAAAAWPLAARVQRAQKTPIVGFLHPGSPEGGSIVLDSLREGFRELGYVEGESIMLEARWARGKPEALPQLTQELSPDSPALDRGGESGHHYPSDCGKRSRKRPHRQRLCRELGAPWRQPNGRIFGCADFVQQVVAIYRRRCAECNEDWRFVGRDHGYVSA